MKEINWQEALSKCFEGFSKGDLPANTKWQKGKVRDVFDLGDQLIITTSDRISAFDRVLGTIPCKGEVLNRLSCFWFNQTKDIIDNHILEEISGRSVRVKKALPLPVEIIVRGYLTGSAWRDYQAGKDISGIKLPSGMRFNQAFDKPLLTPSTKAEQGEHDQPISAEEIVKSGLVEAGLWKEVEEAAQALFLRGTKIAAKQGLILVDTKYEMALLNGKLILIDEIHTPDSSRFWYADSYQELFEKSEKQRKLDKEYLRQWLMERGYSGDGEAPHIPDEVRIEVAKRYITAFEQISGQEFDITSKDSSEEKKLVIEALN